MDKTNGEPDSNPCYSAGHDAKEHEELRMTLHIVQENSALFPVGFSLGHHQKQPTPHGKM